jgi:uncharacterized membrane protein
MIRNVSRTVTVDVPIDRAYEIWTDFESFPQFLTTVEEVRLDGDRLHWRTASAHWTAAITELTPNHRVSWQRLHGPKHHAVVSLRPIGPHRTQIILGAEYELPPGAPDNRPTLFEHALERFKSYAEHEELIPRPVRR